MQNRTHHSPVRRLLKPMERRLWQPLSRSCGNSSSKPAPAVQAGGSHLAQITGTWGIYSKTWTSPRAKHHLQSTTATTTSPLKRTQQSCGSFKLHIKKNIKIWKALTILPEEKGRGRARGSPGWKRGGTSSTPELRGSTPSPASLRGSPCCGELSLREAQWVF